MRGLGQTNGFKVESLVRQPQSPFLFRRNGIARGLHGAELAAEAGPAPQHVKAQKRHINLVAVKGQKSTNIFKFVQEIDHFGGLGGPGGPGDPLNGSGARNAAERI